MKLRKTPYSIALILILCAWGIPGWAQTCTIVDPDSNPGTNTTVNWASATCSETGLAPATGNTIVVPVGVNLTLPNNGTVPQEPTAFFTGNIIVFGRFTSNRPNALLNGNLRIKSGGLVTLNARFFIGNTAGCGYTLAVEDGGTLSLGGSGGSDRLHICGESIAQSGGGCNAYPAGPPPYCEPSGGFTGPTGFDENGFNPTLPVKLALFHAAVADQSIVVSWATSKEEGFDYFILQHATNGNHFADLEVIPGAGYDVDTYREYRYVHTTPIIGSNYYRLKAVDLDGSYEYFGPVAQVFSGTRNVRIYPNPTNGEFIHVDLNFNPSEGSRLAILNSQGVEVMNLMGVGSSNRVELHSLTPGMYMLKFSSHELTEMRKFMVK